MWSDVVVLSEPLVDDDLSLLCCGELNSPKFSVLVLRCLSYSTGDSIPLVVCLRFGL